MPFEPKVNRCMVKKDEIGTFCIENLTNVPISLRVCYRFRFILAPANTHIPGWGMLPKSKYRWLVMLLPCT